MTEAVPATERQPPSLTVRQKILAAGAELARESGDGTFAVAALIVRAWARSPESFTLQGSEHPDSNAVLAKLSGADGLCGLGWFERVAPRRYRLTRRGRELGEQLLPPPPAPPAPRPEAVLVAPPPPPTPPIRPEEVATVRFVADLAQSDALRKFLRGSPLTAVDARRFWGIERLAEADARIAETEQRLKRAVESFSADRPGIPGLPSLSTCFGLLNLHRMMRARFAAELGALDEVAL